MKHRFPRGYPVSTAGLSPTQRCIDLRQRALLASAIRRPVPLCDQMFDNLIAALSRHGFTACGGWSNGAGDIAVFQLGGGWHRDSRPREYTIKNGRVVSISRGESP